VDVYPLQEEILGRLPENARTWPFGNEGDLVDVAGDMVLDTTIDYQLSILDKSSDSDARGLMKEKLMERVDWWIDDAEEDE
jgi:hypothetical protein